MCNTVLGQCKKHLNSEIESYNGEVLYSVLQIIVKHHTET